MTSTDRPAAAVATRRFYPQLEGMRALAALGVLTTHVSFQTGAVNLAVLGPVLGRLDLAVAVFFALSGFLLWRAWVDRAYTDGGHPPIRRYLRHRVVRIWPAYVVVVTLVLLLLPAAQGADTTVWLANLTLTQVFVPLSLTAGLTQMWSLSVEVAFYLLLPFLGLALRNLSGRRARWRVPALLVLGAVSLTWAWAVHALPIADGVEPKNWVFGHLPWFLAGLLLAELAGAVDVGRTGRWSRHAVAVSARRRVMFVAFVAAYALACTPLAGPTGLGALTELEFATKMVLGAVCGYALLAPLVVGDPPFRFLCSPVMLALGRWSYGIFIWHLAVLEMVFPLFGIIPFSGDALLVWMITVVLTIGVSAASYAFLEEPARRWLRAREDARTRSSSVTSASVPEAGAEREKTTSQMVSSTDTSAGA
ncbi:acyltransferase [Gordonia sp. ABSL1-1]|uniref:acyltransferase family protein n=1 Tax=Gordonia sp. ABSL1-1 TaxID=3053923 RepID=UPI0033658381